MNNENTSKKKSVAKKVGDAVERLGRKIESTGLKRTGSAIERFGNKIEHSKEKNR